MGFGITGYSSQSWFKLRISFATHWEIYDLYALSIEVLQKLVCQLKIQIASIFCNLIQITHSLGINQVKAHHSTLKSMPVNVDVAA